MFATISDNLSCYEDRLSRATGCSLTEIAFLSADFERLSNGVAPALPVPARLEEKFESAGGCGSFRLTPEKGLFQASAKPVAISPGIWGFPADVTRKAGVAGIAEAAERGAGIFLMADDDDFIAFSPRTGSVVRNRESAARGFITVLDKMCGGVAGRSVLVVGMGPVGQYAGLMFFPPSERIPAFMTYSMKDAASTFSCRSWQTDENIVVERDLGVALVEYDLVVDATPASDIIDETVVGNGTFVVAPGVPQGVTDGARRKLGVRFYHDKLELGVAGNADAFSYYIKIFIEGEKNE